MIGPLAQLDYQVLTVFTLSAFVAIWSVVVVSGFLPLDLGPAVSRQRLGIVLLGTSAVAIVGLIVSLGYLAALQPWTVTIIAAGTAILAAPFLVEMLPTRFRESKGALGVVLVLCSISLILVNVLIVP